VVVLWQLIRVAIVAASLALDVFAVSIGVGMREMPPWAKVRIGVSFAAAEVGMTLLGIVSSMLIGRVLGDVAGYLGFAAMIAVGIFMMVEALGESQRELDLSRGWGLFLASLSISIDSLGIGFSVLYIGVPLPMMIAAIAVASMAATAAGLAFGRLLGAAVRERAGLLAGAILIATGVLFAYLKWHGVE
jgi:putative Mn2+ efflux pump MntP